MFLFGTGYKSTNQRKYHQEKKKDIDEYPCIQKDETAVKVGFELIWIWVAIIEPKDKEILSFDISKERNMFVAFERFLSI